MNLKPLHDYIVVEKVPEKKREGIIELVNSIKPTKGTVVAVGPGILTHDGSRTEMQLTAGDVVVFPEKAGMNVEVDGETIFMLREVDVVGILS